VRFLIISLAFDTEMDGFGDDLLLLMQFPAGEIGRKLSLTLSPHVDDNDATTPGTFRAREFPIGTGMFRFRLYDFHDLSVHE